MTRATVSYCVQCGERIAGVDIVAHQDEDFCLACWRGLEPSATPRAPPTRAPTGAVNRGDATATAPREAAPAPGGETTRRRRAGQSTRTLPRPSRGMSPQAALMAGAAVLGLVAGALGYLALGPSAPDPPPVDATPPPTHVERDPTPPTPPPRPPVRPVVDPDEDLQPPPVGSGSSDTPVGPRPVAVGVGTLIGNRRSMKLHRAGCEFGEKTVDHNRETFEAALVDRALAQGYKWCSACGPGAGSK